MFVCLLPQDLSFVCDKAFRGACINNLQKHCLKQRLLMHKKERNMYLKTRHPKVGSKIREINTKRK